MDASLRVIASKASSIHERLTPDFVPDDDPAHNEIIEKRMRRWLMTAAYGDIEDFQRRLAWDGLDHYLARRCVGPVHLRSDVEIPQWALTLGEVLRTAPLNTERERCLKDRNPIPFQDVLAPFVTWARSACKHKAASAYAYFNENAHAALERQLLQWLSAQAARPLLLEMSLEVSESESHLDRLLDSAVSREGYESFARRMRSGGLLSFFEEYSVLARVLSIGTQLWVEATVEMLERFRADAHAIASMVGVRDDSKITSVTPSLSDLHNGLRSVAILTFSPGKQIVYKPRTVGIEVAWNMLLRWLIANGAPATLKTFDVLDRGSYGWAEYVEYSACKDKKEAREYYERAGALLCVVHLLQGTDCHADNIIPAGAHPILIDLETMLTPEILEPAIGAESTRLARNRLTRSVLCTHLLPVWSRRINDGEVFDGSGFGADSDEERGLTGRRWTAVNTDRMRVERVPLEQTPHPRAASAGGKPLRVYEYETELVLGFEGMYRFIVRNREALLTRDGPFDLLKEAQVRFVYRNTAVYLAVLDRLTNPDLFRDGAERSIEIEHLASAALSGAKADGRTGWMDIWNAERKAIDRGDVPHFTALAGNNALSIGSDQTILEWFGRSGHAAAAEHLNIFSDSDLSFQIDLIHSTLRSRAVALEAAPAYCGTGLASSPTPAPVMENPDLWIAEARAIAESFERTAMRGSDGSVSWLQPAWSRGRMKENSRREFDVVGHDLYEGAAGLGLFLAAVERVTGGAGLRPLAIGAVSPVMIEIEERGDDLAEHLGIGGLCGLGSIVYGLVRMNSLLGESALLYGAERAASLITSERIDADTALDVTLGSAGALLGLLALYETNASASTLASALHCGRRLISRLEPAMRGVRSVRTLDGRFLTGFSHGAAGIAYALCRLHSITRDAIFLDAASEIVEFERRSFSVEHGDWPDLRYPGPPRFVSAWCHGAPGIALGRIGSLDSMDDGDVRREIERALAITGKQQDPTADYLCCGTFGSVEILGTAGRLLGRPELGERAHALAWQMISRAKVRGEYALGLPSAGELRCLGLFQGLAGAGFTLLRLAAPEIVPELLLLS